MTAPFLLPSAHKVQPCNCVFKSRAGEDGGAFARVQPVATTPTKLAMLMMRMWKLDLLQTHRCEDLRLPILIWPQHRTEEAMRYCLTLSNVMLRTMRNLKKTIVQGQNSGGVFGLLQSCFNLGCRVTATIVTYVADVFMASPLAPFGVDRSAVENSVRTALTLAGLSLVQKAIPVSFLFLYRANTQQQ